MPTIDEQDYCHFFKDMKCRVLITEDQLKLLLEEADENGIISMIPSPDTSICTNCLIALLLERLGGPIIKDFYSEEESDVTPEEAQTTETD